MLYLLERAWCPLAVVSAPVRERAAARSTTTWRSRAAGRSTRMGRTPHRRPAIGRAATRRGRGFGRHAPADDEPSGVSAFVTGRLAGDRPSPTTSTGGRRSARRRSSCAGTTDSGCSSAGSWGTRRAPRRPTTCGRSSREDAARTVSGRGPAPPRSSGHLETSRGPWMPGPARRSGSGSRRSTAAGLDGRGRYRRRADLAPDELTRRSVQRGDHLGDRRGDRVRRVAAVPDAAAFSSASPCLPDRRTPSGARPVARRGRPSPRRRPPSRGRRAAAAARRGPRPRPPAARSPPGRTPARACRRSAPCVGSPTRGRPGTRPRRASGPGVSHHGCGASRSVPRRRARAGTRGRGSPS